MISKCTNGYNIQKLWNGLVSFEMDGCLQLFYLKSLVCIMYIVHIGTNWLNSLFTVLVVTIGNGKVP